MLELLMQPASARGHAAMMHYPYYDNGGTHWGLWIVMSRGHAGVLRHPRLGGREHHSP